MLSTKLSKDMDVRSIIAARRDGRAHTREELVALANGAADGSIPDYQLSAWLMAGNLNPIGAPGDGLVDAGDGG